MVEPIGDRREVEVVVGKAKPLKVNEAKKTTIGWEFTKETATAKIKADHIASILVALHTIPLTTIVASAVISRSPGYDLRMSSN